MHQHPRTPPVTAASANSPRTNPSRTNNQRDKRQDTGGPLGDNRGLGINEGSEPAPQADIQEPGRDAMSKLNQIIQNYHGKAALIILHSRITLPPAYSKNGSNKRVNKWFNVELDETDVLRQDLAPWKTCDAELNRPSPLIIEIYLDSEELTSNQKLVILDDQGKRWQVFEPTPDAISAGTGRRRPKLRNEVVLERWRIELGPAPRAFPNDADLGPILPTVYKKSIVLFRSLFTYSKFLPAWKLTKRLGKNRHHNVLKLKYRIYSGDNTDPSGNSDPLTSPLYDGNSRVIEKYSFGSTDSPAGPFSVQVSYRLNCDFRVDDSEQLLSSHFMGIDDEEFFKPSLPSAEDSRLQQTHSGQEAGSLPTNGRDAQDRPDRSQAYGSLSTFHQVGPTTGSSPLSALRAARELGTQSPTESPPTKQPPNLRSVQGSKASIRSTDSGPNMIRRPSVSFQPFKAPSLSASPSLNETPIQVSPRTAAARTSALTQLTEARGASNASATASDQKAVPALPENAVTSSTSSSPKPAPISSRYSSSFSNRRARVSSGAGSKGDEDNTSSGKGSAASSAHPGSGVLAEAGTGSSGSIHEDDQKISEFLKELDLKKDLKSFHSIGDAGGDASTKRTSAALNRFHRMRDSNAALSDSMSSSLLLHRSSSSSSRQLSSVPPMVAGTSMSTSSSPGKPISPHTPHTPAIPSRLSANSIIAYDNRGDRRHRLSHEEHDSPEGTTSEETALDSAAPNPNAIDIPTPPRPFIPAYRRSSSVAQRGRVAAVEDEMGDLLPFGMRSLSMGADDRPPPSLSALLGLQEQAAQQESGRDDVQDASADPGPEMLTGETIGDERSSSPEYRDYATQSNRAGSYRPRIGRVPSATGRGYTAAQGSMSSDRGSGSGVIDHRGGRYSWSRAAINNQYEEDEPLLFALNDIGASRRSLEEAPRGGSSQTSRRSSKKSVGHQGWA